MGSSELALYVAQAHVDGSTKRFQFRTRREFVDIIALLFGGSETVAGVPNVEADEAEDKVYMRAERFVNKLGDENGCRLAPSARGWWLRLVHADGTDGEIVFERPSWGDSTAAAVRLPAKLVIPPDEERDEFGAKVLAAPPVSKPEREEFKRVAYLEGQQAETALVGAAAEGGAQAPVAQLLHVCAERSVLLEAVFAPKLAAAVADVLSADSSLGGAIEAYVQKHKVVMMLQLRGKAIKLGHDKAAAAREAAQAKMRADPNLSTGGAVTKVGNDKAAAASEAAQAKLRDDPNLSTGGALTKVRHDKAAAASEAAQAYMRDDPNLSTTGALTKVSHDKAAAASEAAQAYMRLHPHLSTSGAVIKVGRDNAPKHCTSSGTQTRYRCKWCPACTPSTDAASKHARKYHAEHFQPKQRCSSSYFCVEEAH